MELEVSDDQALQDMYRDRGRLLLSNLEGQPVEEVYNTLNAAIVDLLIMMKNQTCLDTVTNYINHTRLVLDDLENALKAEDQAVR